MAEVGGGGVLGILGGLVGTIASAVRAFFGITAEQLIKYLNVLKELILQLSHELFVAAFRIARAVARGVRAFAGLALNGIRSFVTIAWEKFQQLEAFLKEKFAPVLRFIRRIKDELNAFYDRFVRPVVQTIEFLRQLNQLLQVFHIDLLKKLDSVLARVEQRIEEPFDWVRKKITWIENWIDRIVTVDGLYRRAVLLSSLSRYAPSWIAGFWNGQIDRANIARKQRAIPRDVTPVPPSQPGAELKKFYRGEPSEFDDDIIAAAAIWREAAGIDPPGSAAA